MFEVDYNTYGKKSIKKVTEDEIALARRFRSIDGLSEYEIAARLGRCRDTVRKMIKGVELTEYAEKRINARKKMFVTKPVGNGWNRNREGI